MTAQTFMNLYDHEPQVTGLGSLPLMCFKSLARITTSMTAPSTTQLSMSRTPPMSPSSVGAAEALREAFDE